MTLTRLVIGCVVLAAGVRSAAAETDACAPTPAWGQAPDWWSDPTTGQLAARFDGRWGGAFQLGYGAGALPSGRFRAVSVGTDIFLSFQLDSGIAYNASSGAEGAVRLYFGLQPMDGTPDIAETTFFRIHVKRELSNAQIDCAAPTAVNPACKPLDQLSASVALFRHVAGTGVQQDYAATAAMATQPWWTQSSRVWSTGSNVTINLRIPRSAIDGPLAAVTHYRLWFELRNCPIGADPSAATGACTRAVRYPLDVPTPVFAEESGVFDPPVLLHPPVADWRDFRIQTACGTGLDLTWSDLGSIAKGAATTCSDAAQAHGALTWSDRSFLSQGTNCLIARVRNSDPATTFPNSITAEYYLADWGSQANFDLAQAEWRAIGGQGAAAGADLPPGGHLDVVTEYDLDRATRCRYSSPVPSIAGDCDGTAGLDVNDLAAGSPYRDHCCVGVAEAWTRKRHQCMYVKLRSSTTVPFVRDSALQNMDFVPASRFWRIATLSLRAVPPGPDGLRVMYLYARAANLPAQIDGPGFPAVDALALAAQLPGWIGDRPSGAPPSPLLRALAGDLKRMRELRIDEGRPTEQQQRALLTMLRQLDPAVLREVAPTLEVQAFRDSGALVADGARQVSLLDEQAGFGYFVEHVGAIEGWSWEIDGAEELGNGWYRVSSRADEALIRTRIQAREASEPVQPEAIRSWPPEAYWLHAPGAPVAAAVPVVSKGGCSAGGGGAGGAVGLLLFAGLIAWARRRAPRRGR